MSPVMKIHEMPKNIRETFSAYFDLFSPNDNVRLDTINVEFFKSVNVDELVRKYGAERVEADYLQLCSMSSVLAMYLRNDLKKMEVKP